MIFEIEFINDICFENVLDFLYENVTIHILNSNHKVMSILFVSSTQIGSNGKKI